MYTISTFFDRTITVSSVAPPVDPKLDVSVQDLSVAHLLIAGGEAFEPFALAIAGLDDEQIDRGRLQWLHTIKEIRDTLNHHRQETSIAGYEPHRMGLSRVVEQMAQAVLKDVDRLALRCDKAPRDARALANWPQALAVLAQAVVFARAMPALHPDDAAWPRIASGLATAFGAAVERCTTFRDTVGPAYQNARDALVDVDEAGLLTAARRALTEQAARPMDLSLRSLGRVMDRLGNRDQLWGMVQQETRREDAIAARHYTPLDAEGAATVRQGMVELLRSFDTYRHSGFLSALRAIGQEQAYCASTTQIYVDTYQDAADVRRAHRRACENIHRREKPTEQELLDDLAKLPQNRRDRRLDAVARLDFARRVDQTVAGLAAVLGTDQRTDVRSMGSTLTLRAQGDGITVGRWNDDPSRVLLVYPDDTVNREDGTYAMVVPAALLDDGVPRFSMALKDRSRDEGWVGTNFPSVASFMREMEEKRVQEWLVGKPFVVLHDNPASPSQHVYAAPHRFDL